MTRRPKIKWHICDDAVGVRSCRKFLDVCSDRSYVFSIATTDYTGTFTKAQRRMAQRVCDALNAAEAMWSADEYSQESR